MDIRSKKTRKAAEKAAQDLNDIEKKQLAMRASFVKKKASLDANQNALRVVEQAIGSKPVEQPIKRTFRK